MMQRCACIRHGFYSKYIKFKVQLASRPTWNDIQFISQAKPDPVTALLASNEKTAT